MPKEYVYRGEIKHISPPRGEAVVLGEVIARDGEDARAHFHAKARDEGLHGTVEVTQLREHVK